MKVWSGALISILLVGCAEPNDWRGWVYPDAADLTQDIMLGSFKSLDQCRAAALRVGQELKTNTGVAFDYECGRNCEMDEELGGLYVCEETVR